MAKYKLPSLEDLLEAGVHFGHQVRRWNPRMSPYIFSQKNGIHVFDLVQTQERLEKAGEFLLRVAQAGGTVVFLGTKRQVKPLVEAEAKRCGSMYITNRWLGGTLTNLDSIKRKMLRLKEVRSGLAEGRYSHYTKRERSLLQRELEKLQVNVGGIENLRNLPQAIVVIDPKKEKTAVNEATRKGVPVVALVDTNCDPRGVAYVIPGNDDASRSVALITATLADAILAGSKKEEPAHAGKIETLGLSTRSTRALEKAGITTVEKLKKLTEKELSQVKGLGKKSLEEVSGVLGRL